MAPKKKVTKEEIIETALTLAEDNGIEFVTVRQIAKELNCSVAPIYVNFENSEAMITATTDAALQLFLDACSKSYTEEPFLNVGIGNIKFALSHPRLYADVIMQQQLNGRDDELHNFMGYMREDDAMSALNDSQLETIYYRVKTFTYGLAMSAVHGLMPDDYTEEMIINMLSEVGDDIVKGYVSRI